MPILSDIQAKINKGSQTAKGGFEKEKDVIIRFNNWQEDLLAQNSLVTMGYNLKEIENVIAQKVQGVNKADVQVLVTVFLKGLDKGQNISVKLVSNKKGFNQVDKRYVSSCTEKWCIPSKIVDMLEYFVGFKKPIIKNPRNKKRMFLNEFSTEEQNELIKFFDKNRILILSDIIKGQGQFAAEWMLVVQKIGEYENWTMKPINFVLNVYNQGDVVITNKGSLKIGKVGLQRKGGDGGRPSANQLQFKIDPMEIAK